MYGSFVNAGLITALIIIVMKSARYKSALIGTLSVDSLVVKDLKVEGNHEFSSDKLSGTESGLTQSLISLVEELKSEVEALKQKVESLSLNDLTDVDTIGRVEDGAFIGWAESENSWVPYPEVGN